MDRWMDGQDWFQYPHMWTETYNWYIDENIYYVHLQITASSIYIAVPMEIIIILAVLFGVIILMVLIVACIWKEEHGMY